MQVITLPISAELLSTVTDNSQECELLKDYLIDISSIKYDDPDLESNKIECSLIYLRNIDLPIPCDFSKLSYSEKEEWIIKYINADLFDLCIKELNETILNLLSDEPIDDLSNILSEDETIVFKDSHKDLLDSIKQFLTSLNLLVEYAIANKDSEKLNDIDLFKDNNDILKIEEKPLFFETVHQLIKYYPIIIDALHLYYENKFNPIFYSFVFHSIEKSSTFYMDILNLPSIKFLGLVLNTDIMETKDE